MATLEDFTKHGDIRKLGALKAPLDAAVAELGVAIVIAYLDKYMAAKLQAIFNA